MGTLASLSKVCCYIMSTTGCDGTTQEKWQDSVEDKLHMLWNGSSQLKRCPTMFECTKRWHDVFCVYGRVTQSLSLACGCCIVCISLAINSGSFRPHDIQVVIQRWQLLRYMYLDGTFLMKNTLVTNERRAFDNRTHWPTLYISIETAISSYGINIHIRSM